MGCPAYKNEAPRFRIIEGGGKPSFHPADPNGEDRPKILPIAAPEPIFREHQLRSSSQEDTDKACGIDGVTKRYRHISTPVGVVAVSIFDESNGSEELNYQVHDALGSVATSLTSSGAVKEHYSYNAWGEVRSASTWELDSMAIVPPTYTKGFTGHAVRNSFGMIHMMWRMYDPELARFTSCDPSLGSATRAMDANRYSYVRNSPLSYTDPSGYFFKKLFRGIKKFFSGVKKFIKKYGRTILAIGVGILTYGALGPVLAGALSSAVSSGGDLKATLQGALFAGLTFGVGSAFGFAKTLTGAAKFWAETGRAAVHGMLGGVRSVLNGGKFAHGFIAGAGSSAFSHSGIMDEGWIAGDGFEHMAARTAAASIVGGTISEISGGKFENGAVTGAFQHLFNAESGRLRHTAHSYKKTWGGEEWGNFFNKAMDFVFGSPEPMVVDGVEYEFKSASVPNPKSKILNIAKGLKEWMGNGGKVITNRSGDKVFMSKDGARKLRFDIKNPAPHKSPHMHIERLRGTKWKEIDRIYPKDVPPH